MNEITEVSKIATELNGAVDKIVKHLPLTLLVLGPCGCGKKTNTIMFRDLLGSTDVLGANTSETLCIDTGDLLRSFSESRDNADLLRGTVSQRMQEGKLVNAASKIFVWYREINSFLKRCPNGNLIFDGSPRDMDEKRVILEFLLSIGRNPIVIEFVVNEHELKKRVSLREDNRLDDNDQAFKERMEIYKSMTSQAIGSLLSAGIPVSKVEVSVDESKEEVFKKFVRAVKKALYRLK